MKSYSRESILPEKFLSDVITITSETGVGGSTILTGFRQRFLNDPNKRFISVSDIMARLTSGMTKEESAKYNRKHAKAGFDRQCDDEVKIIGFTNGYVIEGRLPHVFVNHGFHVLLTCPINVRALRRQKDLPNLSLEQVVEMIRQRDKDDNTRYTKLYPDCLWPKEDYDLHLSTDRFSPEEIIDKILKNQALWVKEMGHKIVNSI